MLVVGNQHSHSPKFSLAVAGVFAPPTGEFFPVDTPPPHPTDPVNEPDPGPYSFPDPTNVKTEFDLDDKGTGFDINEKVGDIDVKYPSHVSMADFLAFKNKKSIAEYWKQKAAMSGDDTPGGFNLLSKNLNSEKMKNIFGSDEVSIRPTGQALLEFSGDVNRMRNPSLPVRQQRTGSFNFDQQIQLNVVGKIGDKLRLNANWDTEATFDFENQFKIEYTGTEDEIVQKVEAGNVSLPLKGSLISGGQNLFGVKFALKFGPMIVTTIASQQKGKTQEITVEGGAQVTKYEKPADQYDVNRHFFLAHHFLSRFDQALSNLPNINSGYNITRVEAWITNTNSASTINNRNAVGFIDLGEQNVQKTDGGIGNVFNDSLFTGANSPYFPDNEVNGLHALVSTDPQYRQLKSVDTALANLGFQNGVDFERVENMRLLDQNEFQLHKQLGYISLNSKLQDNQVLFVCYEYQVNGQSFQVGEFTQDKPVDQYEVLHLKMLKPSAVRPFQEGKPYPTWDLMMKNIYNIGGFGLKADNFKFEIYYKSPTSAGDLAYLPDGLLSNKQLLQVFKMDQLTNNGTSTPDNQFDFIEGVTILADRGIIIFPVVKPFGENLINQFKALDTDPDKTLALEDSAKYAFPQLYEKTQMDAIQLHQDVNRYLFKGSYQGSSSSEISLNAINIAPGSVKVTANGMLLQEGLDYTVDYQIGKVNIVNQGVLTSGQQVKVAFETNTLFGIESKTLVGSRFDFILDKNIQLGATVLHLNERPITQKINIGDEPLSNTMLGVDAIINKDSRFVSKLVGKIPMLKTSGEVSTVNAGLEGATLLPGHPKSISVKNEETGVEEKGIAYLDDFESSKTTFDLSGYKAWQFSAFPGDNGNNSLFDPRSFYGNALAAGYSRSKLAWYSIDPNFFFNNPDDKFPKDDLCSHYSRQINPNEVFQAKDLVVGDNLLRTFDMYYLPSERGPYNYQTDPAKLNTDGTFKNPEENFGGIMRKTTGNTDFEASNYEFLEFWMLDPFLDDSSNSGELYINLGKINEDIIPDNRRSFENGLNEDGDYSKMDTTSWGFVPRNPAPTLAFSNEETARQFQDVGFDGMEDAKEKEFFKSFLDSLAIFLNAEAFAKLESDPSSDRYHYFRGDDLNTATQDGTRIVDRYKNVNGTEGNTPLDAIQNGYSIQGSANPDTEDINVNGTLNTNEEYWEYKIKMSRNDLKRGYNFVVDEIPAETGVGNSECPDETVIWYQFRIPLTAGTPIGPIQNFKSIDFMRMYMTGFERPVVMRFAKYQLVATSWRTFKGYLGEDEEQIIVDPPAAGTTFEIGTVNIEDNGSRTPFPYVTPPNVIRESIIGNIQQQGTLQNEQALVLKSCNLQDGDGRGAFRLMPFDLRSYKNLKMWIHAEAADIDNPALSNFDSRGDVRAFVRLGTDNSENYYEYEIPLTPSTNFGSGLDTDIWLSENQFSFPLSILGAAKALRNEELDVINRPELLTSRFRVDADSFPALFEEVAKFQNISGHSIYVVGTPKLSEVKSMVVGIRNPDEGNGPVCVETWFNELRVTDFNEQAGYAANGRMSVKLSDFGNITASGMVRTPGFGAIEQRINARSRELVKQYDLAATLNLGKFFGPNSGMEIPLYLTWGERFIDPQFNPLESDVETKAYLATFGERGTEDYLLRRTAIQDYSRNKSISLNNIRRNRTDQKKKPHFWDIENWAVSMAVNETFQRNYQIDDKTTINHKAGLKYNFTFTPKLIEPFKKSKMKNPVTLFNFYLGPKSFNFSMNGDRRFEYNKLRQTAGYFAPKPTYFRDFKVTRQTSLRWDFTKSLNLTINASNLSRVDEPLFAVHDSLGNADSIWSNLLHIGRQKYENPNDTTGYYLPGKDKYLNIGRDIRYNHTINAGYQLPFDKMPWTDWINGQITYGAGLTWQAAPDNNRSLGNTLGNTQNIQATGRLVMTNLYKKIPGIKKLVVTGPAKGGTKPGDRGSLSAPDVKPEAKKDTASDDSYHFLKIIGKEFAKVLVSLQNVDLTWSQTSGTTIPGYLPHTDWLGMDIQYYYDTDSDTNTFTPALTPMLPPTWQFISGLQPSSNEILGWGRNNGWLTKNQALSSPMLQNVNEQFTGRTSLVLLKDLKIDLNATMSKTENFSALLRYGDTTGAGNDDFFFGNQLRNGTFSSSYIFWPSAFEKIGEESEAFTEFSNSRFRISERIATQRQNEKGDTASLIPSIGSYNGYTRSSQEVLLPAFLAAYGPGSQETIGLNSIPKIPLPNWSIKYNGLGNLPGLSDIFNSVAISHGYRGMYSVNQFTSNINYKPGRDPGGNETPGYTDEQNILFTDSSGATSFDVFNYLPQFNIPTVSITESFAPLLGISVTMENGVNGSLDYKMSRTLSFNVGAMQMTENRTKEMTISIGWRKDKMDEKIMLFGKEVRLTNALNARMDFTFKDMITRNRILDQENSPVTGGNKTILIKPQVDYTVNRRLNVMFFMEQNINKPRISTTFPTSFTSIGFRIRFTLS